MSYNCLEQSRLPVPANGTRPVSDLSGEFVAEHVVIELKPDAVERPSRGLVLSLSESAPHDPTGITTEADLGKFVINEFGPPTLEFETVRFSAQASGDLEDGHLLFQLVVWYQCRGTHWERLSVNFKAII